MTHAATLAKAASAIGNASVSSTYPSFNPGKNAIINGAFDIWQRGTSFAAIANGIYSADRWQYSNATDAVHTVSRSTDVPTVAQAGILASYSLLADCTTLDATIAAGQYAAFSQKIEGFNWRQFAQRALTLSFWVKATKTGTYCVALKNDSDRSYVAEYTVSASDTWEKKTVNITASPSAGTWDYTTSNGAGLWFSLACGSTFQTTAGSWQTGNYLATSNQVNACDSDSNNFRIALVQLEVGSVATDFEITNYGLELAKCQRYYSVIDGVVFDAATASSQGLWYLPVTMRATPTVSLTIGSGTGATLSLLGPNMARQDGANSVFAGATGKFTAEL